MNTGEGTELRQSYAMAAVSDLDYVSDFVDIVVAGI